MKFTTLTAFLIALALPASAIEFRPCDEFAVSEIPEPWSKYTRSFQDGQFRLILIGSGEPVCCGVHFAVLLPSDTYERQCVSVVRSEEYVGWSDVFIGEAWLVENKGRGFELNVPVKHYDHDEDGRSELEMIVLFVDLENRSLRMADQ